MIGKSLRPFIPALVLMAFSLVCVAAMTMAPRPGEPVAVVFPPWVSAHSALQTTAAASAMDIWGQGGWKNVVIASSDDPLFAQKVISLGALIVLRAPGKGGCFKTN